jgi:hypothetical protein
MRPHRNRGLFSNYYLDELLPKEEEFKILVSEVKAVFEKVKGIWDKSRFEAINEDQLRKHFLDKVLDYLGWAVDVNAPVPAGEWSKRPDYALFQSSESLKTAQKGKKNDYFKRVTCVAEAKRWGRPLDKKLKTEADPFEVQNPSLQISRYLWLTGVKWGVLTDGKYWRLYERETSKRLDIFYEIDLEDLIESGTPEDFRYFYLLFRRDAFPEFIEKVYKGSVDYAEEVGEELKENIYQALKTLAQGFLKTSGNSFSEKHLKEIHDNSLILLYRLLFILYAEHRDLLPLRENKLYTDSYSLDSFKKEIANKLDKNVSIASSTIGYWNKLKELFEIINKGNRELGVPPYNGGLFDQEKHNFFEKHKVGDSYVAKAIDLLSRSKDTKDKAYIDYGSLDIRHLGSIYEGLLEYKLRIADQDLFPIKDKGKEKFVPLVEDKKTKKSIREDEIIQAGEIYLVTDKGERKATGSYYTPGYIVEYIIENTLGPLVEKKRKKVSENIEELKKKIKGSRGASKEFLEKELRKAEGNLIDELLSLKVLDPAMGSGHFLVEATDFLARKLLEVLSGEPLEEHEKEMVFREPSEPYGLKESEEDIRWARREVVERCIFGVDLNPMAVELAKLSLWLYTVAKGKPLNFLDHHLKCGNSLMDAKVEDLHHIPGKKKKNKDTALTLSLPIEFPSLTIDLGLAVGDYLLIEQIASEDVKDIKKKTDLYQNLNKERIDKWRDIANIWISSFFGVKIDQKLYKAFSDSILGKEERIPKEWVEEYLNKALNLAKEKNFFHWELEFPEVFYDHHGKSSPNPGFDVIIGNPPYGVAFDSRSKAFLKGNYKAAEYQFDSFALFIEKALSLLRKDGFQAYITPTTWLSEHYYENLRGLILANYQLEQVIFFKEPVFKDATVETCIEVVKKDRPDSKSVLMLGIVFDIPEKLNIKWVEICQQKIEDFAGKRITEYLTPQILEFLEKILKESFLLKNIGDICNGLKPYEVGKGTPPQTKKIVQGRIFDSDYKKDDTYKPYLRGEDFHKFNLNPQESRWISYGEWLAAPRPETPFFVNKKIIIRQTADSIIAAIDDEQYLNLNNVHNLVSKMENYSLEFILSVLNSKFLSFVHRVLVPEFGRVFAEVKIVNLEKLPIRQISFVTSRECRKKLFNEAESHYKKFLETSKPDTFLCFIESRIIREHKPDAELVKKHNADPLNKDWQIPEGIFWEQSDVVHDILAFLAEQMIEMNKEKQKEIKGYLEWIEGQLKVQPDSEGGKGVDALTGKTHIENYLGDYQKKEEPLPFEGFWKILEKNKTRIQANLKSRELYENIKSEYEKSLSKLLPLKEKLHKTDWLIDQIVYKLYGLTDEEIKIVGGNR